MNYIQDKVEIIKPEEKVIILNDGGNISYDILIIATGTK